tara:strand:- start:245 stop:466 length:222 start_codon:yes stop_codon:yes gene_type:complete
MIITDDENNLPQSLLQKIYDATGSASGGNKGFLLVYVNSEGSPSISSKTENACVEMALGKVIEIFVSKEKEAE